SPAVMLRPNIQYIHQPAGVKEVDDAWVAGLSVKVNF
ncbi:carbohydrate porin, partial [Acinetobacter baumannii]